MGVTHDHPNVAELGWVRDCYPFGGHDAHGLCVDKALVDDGLSVVQRLEDVDCDVITVHSDEVIV